MEQLISIAVRQVGAAIRVALIAGAIWLVLWMAGVA